MTHQVLEDGLVGDAEVLSRVDVVVVVFTAGPFSTRLEAVWRGVTAET